jgi:hypothetical protein
MSVRIPGRLEEETGPPLIESTDKISYQIVRVKSNDDVFAIKSNANVLRSTLSAPVTSTAVTSTTSRLPGESGESKSTIPPPKRYTIRDTILSVKNNDPALIYLDLQAKQRRKRVTAGPMGAKGTFHTFKLFQFLIIGSTFTNLSN